MPRKDRNKLTKIQLDTLKNIKEYIAKNGVSPTLSEIAKDFGLKSPQTVSDRLTALRKKGFIKNSLHSWRNIELADSPVGNSKLVHIPVVGLVGADQMSVFAQEEYGQFLQVEEKLLNGHREVIAIRVVGNSMRDANIHDGDYIFVENDNKFLPKNGDIVAVVIDDVAVVKEFYQGKNLIELRPCSKDPQYSPIMINPKSENFRIIGRVINVLNFSEENKDDYQVIPEPGEKL